ncbi:hypothetical protein CARUB_v10015409mg [Capsella rubella]|uniref:F-box domain-containing protein n=1 Tax=Capsella rubella TaxID=81985 RepID=R0G926_9BRAS|nr:putative F-box protein At3g24580 [Capsella rubella]EOA32157.1 hypothetical protein CARUB_v10015409mg [Capsella rubella]
MTNMSNLPRKIAEEILSRVPVKCLRAVRLTCKKWNTLSKDMRFITKHVDRAKQEAAKKKEFMLIMMINFRVYLMHVNVHNNVGPCMRCEGKFTSLDELVDINRVFLSDGLLLSISKDCTKLMAWNPYSGKSRWIEFESSPDLMEIYMYALGYEKSNDSCNSYKILRFVENRSCFEYKIYDFNYDSWRVLDISLYDKIYKIAHHKRGVSLKGNTYWFGKSRYGSDVFLVCFDFTSESFGPPLSLPFEYSSASSVLSLSRVREEQLAVMLLRFGEFTMDIWITTRIEPSAVSWNSEVFLAVNLRQVPFNGIRFEGASFFIDEEESFVVVFDNNSIAYIVGVDGTIKKEYFKLSKRLCCPIACSYVPSLVL